MAHPHFEFSNAPNQITKTYFQNSTKTVDRRRPTVFAERLVLLLDDIGNNSRTYRLTTLADSETESLLDTDWLIQLNV
jgi:hypothetical protein